MICWFSISVFCASQCEGHHDDVWRSNPHNECLFNSAECLSVSVYMRHMSLTLVYMLIGLFLLIYVFYFVCMAGKVCVFVCMFVFSSHMCACVCGCVILWIKSKEDIKISQFELGV